MSSPGSQPAALASRHLTPPTARAAAAALIAHGDRAALATFAPSGAPCGSLVTVVSDGDLDVRFALGDGCEHQRNLAHDGRATVLVTKVGALGEAPSKVALSGRARVAGRDAAGTQIYRLALETVRLTVAGSVVPVCLDG